MKRNTYFWLLALVVCVAFAGLAIAAEQQKPMSSQPGQTTLPGKQPEQQGQTSTPGKQPMQEQQAAKPGQENMLPPQQRASQVIGMAVYGVKGEKLGKIDEIVFTREGCARYALLSHGGLLGIGDKLVPLPWNALKPGKEEKSLMVNMDKQTLEKAPNFDRNKYPDVSSPEWQKSSQYHGGAGAQEPKREAAATRPEKR